MAALTWDELPDRIYQTGVDKVVLYDKETLNGVAWNGVTGVTENARYTSENIYYSGEKRHDVIKNLDYSATLSAFSYPEEVLTHTGCIKLANGVYLADQRPKLFNLSYRTLIGDTQTDTLGYKLHMIYNVMATPNNTSTETDADGIAPVVFNWDISTTSSDLDAFNNSASIIVDTRAIDPLFLDSLYVKLYGDENNDAWILDIQAMLTFIEGGI